MINNLVRELPNPVFADLMIAVLQKGAPFRFRASGCSMSPFIRHEDVITIAPKQGRIRRGDIVAFIDPANGRLVVHRVVRAKSKGFLLRGDNCWLADGWIPQNGIVGRVVRIEHHGKLVRIGMGRERILIAMLSRMGILRYLVVASHWIVRPIYRKYFV